MKRRLAWVGVVCGAVLFSAACRDDETSSGGGVPSTDAGVDAPGQDAAPDVEAEGSILDGIRIDGLEGEVSAVYDEHGILHLRCQSDADCVAALGYFHAANRFFQMDFARRFVRGKLGALVKAGDLVLQQDFAKRHFMTDANGEPLEQVALAALEPETAQLLERYAVGVNAWLADVQAERNGAKPSTEYDFGLMDKSKMFMEWEAADSLAVALSMMDKLGNTVREELAAGEVAASYPPDLAADLLSVRPAFTISTSSVAGLPSVNLQPTVQPPDFSYLAGAANVMHEAWRRQAPVLDLPKGDGSNNWAIGPERTKSKKALLANDPHLALSNPATFFPVELDSVTNGSGTLHAAGGTVAGIPLVLIGRNETIAWGLTTVQWDLNEVYVEQLSADGKSVIFNGEEVALTEKELTFDNAAGDPVTQTFKWVPHHGPLIAEDEEAGTGISVRWVAAEGLTDADSLLALMRAKRVQDLPVALDRLTTTNQNFVAIDVEGNIGWFPYSKVPSRPWASASVPPWLPVTGDGTTEWDGFIPCADLPQGMNPDVGFFATANAVVTDGNFDGDPTDTDKAFHTLKKALGLRLTRIVDLIEANTSNDHTVDTMLEIQKDTYSIYGATVTPAVLAATQAATLSPSAQAVVDALTDWQYTCPTGLATSDQSGEKDSDAARVAESVGCTAFHAVLYKLIGLALGDENAAAGVEAPMRLQHNVILTAFTAPDKIVSNFWDDVETVDTVETRDDILLAAVIAAGEALATWEPASTDWQWGKLHDLTLYSAFSAMGIPMYDEGPYANDGALFTVDVADPKVLRSGGDLRDKDMDFGHEEGSALRMVIEASEGSMVMKWQLPGGTSLDRDGPRYNQLLDGFLANESVDFPFGAGAIASPQESLTVKPSSE